MGTQRRAARASGPSCGHRGPQEAQSHRVASTRGPGTQNSRSEVSSGVCAPAPCSGDALRRVSQEKERPGPPSSKGPSCPDPLLPLFSPKRQQTASGAAEREGPPSSWSQPGARTDTGSCSWGPCRAAEASTGGSCLGVTSALSPAQPQSQDPRERTGPPLEKTNPTLHSRFPERKALATRGMRPALLRGQHSQRRTARGNSGLTAQVKREVRCSTQCRQAKSAAFPKDKES